MSDRHPAGRSCLWLLAVLGVCATASCGRVVDSCWSNEQCLPFVRPTIASVCVDREPRRCSPEVIECNADADCPHPYLCIEGYCDLGEVCGLHSECGADFECPASVNRCVRR